MLETAETTWKEIAQKETDERQQLMAEMKVMETRYIDKIIECEKLVIKIAEFEAKPNAKVVQKAQLNPNDVAEKSSQTDGRVIIS